MLNLRDLIVEIDGVLDADFCENVINKFEKDPRVSGGVCGTGFDTDTKRSTDLFISKRADWAEYDQVFYEKLLPHSTNYIAFLKDKLGLPSLASSTLIDTGYQIQRTDPDGFYSWHTDDAYFFVEDTDIKVNRVGYERRLYTYIFYLNDVTDGGRTQFSLGGDEYFSITPKTGKLILFPANVLYTHRGELLNSGVKYLTTGWVSDHIIYASKDSSEFSESMIEGIKGIL